MSLLTIVQDASVLVGLAQPAAAISSTDPNVVAMIAMVNQTGKELMRRHNWQALQTEKTFTTIAAALQTNAVPSDFDRIINRTLYNRTQKRKFTGPLSPAHWQRRQALTSAGIYGFFRIKGTNINIDPVPGAGDSCAYEYITENWVTGDKAKMDDDTDTALLDENLLMLGAIWKFLKARGLEYAEDFRTYEVQTETMWARDGGRDTISMDGDFLEDDPERAYVPDGDWDIT